MQRRNLLRAVAGVAFLRPDAVNRALAATSGNKQSAEELARDEDFWREIQMAFRVDRSLINFNNGAVSPSPRIVQDAVENYMRFSNLAPVHTMWRVLGPQIESVRRGLARAFGCDPEEMAITRNASEALEICQLGLDLKRGDEVLTTDHDYPRMITTWKQRERRDGIVVKYISFPVPPPSMDDLYQRFERAITPRTRVIHFCHITNTTGQIFPVRRICRMARQRGIETIVDGAHAFAHFPYRYADLECDYYGTSLHKWLLAPHGTGFLFVRKEKIRGLWPLMAATEAQDNDIRKFEEIGTHAAAIRNAISEALTFHESIGVERKAARLRYLRQLWTERLAQNPRVRMLTSPDPQQSCGLATFVAEGKSANELTSRLFEQARVIVTGMTVKDQFEGIRVTPNIYSTFEEVDIFCSAMEKLLRQG